eukprot:5324332-Prymnesium_polylepis.1
MSSYSLELHRKPTAHFCPGLPLVRCPALGAGRAAWRSTSSLQATRSGPRHLSQACGLSRPPPTLESSETAGCRWCALCRMRVASCCSRFARTTRTTGFTTARGANSPKTTCCARARTARSSSTIYPRRPEVGR